MPQKVTTFLMFEGRAEEAMNFYAETFTDTTVKKIERYGPDGPGKEGSVVHALMDIAGLELAFTDSFVSHEFTFTPSISLFVDCETEEELKRVYARLVDGGEAMMPLGNYGFSQQFGWVADRFGVSWQLNLP